MNCVEKWKRCEKIKSVTKNNTCYKIVTDLCLLLFDTCNKYKLFLNFRQSAFCINNTVDCWYLQRLNKKRLIYCASSGKKHIILWEYQKSVLFLVYHELIFTQKIGYKFVNCIAVPFLKQTERKVIEHEYPIEQQQ